MCGNIILCVFKVIIWILTGMYACQLTVNIQGYTTEFWTGKILSRIKMFGDTVAKQMALNSSVLYGKHFLTAFLIGGSYW